MEETKDPAGSHDSEGHKEEEEECPKLSSRQLELLQLRREEELKIIAKYDSMPLNRYEAWFLVDAEWVAQWLEFVNAKPEPQSEEEGATSGQEDEGEEAEPSSNSTGNSRLRTLSVPGKKKKKPLPPAKPGPPGRLSTKRLLDTETGKPFPNLQKVTHYRGINPTVWFLYKEFYGMDDSPPILRYEVNIYDEDVSPKSKLESTEGPSLKACCEARQIRAKLYPQEVFDIEEKIFCCITRSLLEKILFCLFTCCAKTRTYRYKRLVMDDEDDDHVASDHEGELELTTSDREDLQRGCARSSTDQYVASV